MLLDTLEECRVLPVVTSRDVGSTLRLAEALAKGGMKAIEVTLRSESALESIRELKVALPDLLVAAGTVTNEWELEAALAAGADFVLSPGSTPQLLKVADQRNVDFVPGVATASEIMVGLDHGYSCFKLFPAVAAGGKSLLKSFGGPFPSVRFCPTGGLNPENFREYLALSNVVCCGGSWMVGSDLIDNGNWQEVETLARACMSDA
jgi:2-dehydro-3-deoxyphosphogluconate aldolase/(4S)-4-hydroxy-2-oxoglutarate aldolase